MLADVGVKLNEDAYFLTSLTRACRLVNDSIRVKLPIQKKLLCDILRSINKLYLTQVYLNVVYKAIFSSAYYGLLRISEVVAGPHQILARNTHIGTNKDKILFILLTSKTHGTGSKPQTVKISGLKSFKDKAFCPFSLLRDYLKIRLPVKDRNKAFFVFADRSPISAACIRTTLRKCIRVINLNPNVYSFHGYCAGRATDMMKMGMSVETIKKLGRWKSNTLYSYLR